MHFEFGVFFNLRKDFSVLPFDLLNLALHLIDLGVFYFDFFAVGFLFSLDLL